MTTFETSQMSTYLLAIVISNFKTYAKDEYIKISYKSNIDLEQNNLNLSFVYDIAKRMLKEINSHYINISMEPQYNIVVQPMGRQITHGLNLIIIR